MRIYVAGPVTGIPDHNRPLFEQTAQRLRHAGHRVYNPTADSYNVARGPAPHGSVQYEEIMERCFDQLLKCDAICKLTGWHASPGAIREVQLARDRGLREGYVEDFVGEDQFLKWTGDPECEPVRGYAGDAGYDLTIEKDCRIHVGAFYDVPLGISVEMPPGVWGMLTGRSSTIRRRRLLVTQGIIDNGYRGPLYAGVQNLGDAVVDLERGERIAQLILFPLILPEPLQVNRLSYSDRGEAGFGSSGA